MNQIRSIRSLKPNELKDIKKAMKTGQNVKLRVRANAIWLLHQGYKPDEIARILDRHRNTIISWLNRYESQGLNALEDSYRSGRPPKADSKFQKRLVKTVKTQPRKLGYNFTNWSAGRLRDHMAEHTGMRISEVQLRRLLHKNGIVFRKPKHELKAKQDPALYNQKKELLEFLKKTRLPVMPVLSFCFLMNVISIFIPI